MRLRRLAFLVVVSVGGICISCGETNLPDSRAIRLSNGLLELEFSREDGTLTRLLDVETRQEFVTVGRKAATWELEILSEGSVASLTPFEAGSFGWEIDSDAKCVVMTWSRFPSPLPPSFRIIVSVDLEADMPASRWHMALEGVDEIGIQTIRFPRLTNIPRVGSQERLAVPLWMGMLVQEPRELLASQPQNHEWEWSYPGVLSLQCLALYQKSGPGLYVASDDAEAYWKTFALWLGPGEALNYEARHFVGTDGTQGKQFALPYGIRLGTFQGDWFTAAERYRDWATEQRWCKLRRNTD